MPRYLWQRASGYVFQITPPQRFLDRFSATPFRIKLGRIPAAEARRRACILAGYAVTRMESRDVSRELVSRGLAAVAAQLEALRREEWGAGLKSLTANTQWREEAEHGSGDPEIIQIFKAAEAKHIAHRDAIRSARARLDIIGAEIRKDGEEWHQERAIYDRTVDRLATLKGKVAEDLPLLSVCAAEIIKTKSDALGEGSGYIARLQRAVRTFVAIIGDKAVDAYVPSDLQTFTAVLGRLPSTWNTDKRLRDLQPLDIIERAKSIRDLKPISKTTVSEYLAEFRHVWKVIRATYPDHVRALGHEDVPITLPRSAARPVTREGLDVEKLNIFLARAARERRPDDRFIPLLGVLTGARLGELVGLQVADVQPFQSHWTLSLVEDIEGEDGEVEERQIKNDGSRRVIALPDAILGTGFLEWVAGLRSGTLWPQLSRAVRPHATASKRMARTMKELGIHEARGQTFHSLRHGCKDWLRSQKVDLRTIDIQLGHAHKDVGATYGSKSLRVDEIRTLATVPLPEGLDLSPYYAPFSPMPARKIGRPRKASAIGT
ncbi:tyrosine-type recombinase/integrase [Microvirga calopogonii]|uniref:tyrosine-type recombinase/integrase n=1 Tax=Microvirga calopogonii TaxID=2078013 RepID=UPI000E0DBCD1|nr:tyrosine-type recombinase/integrase [Microvirga calopogonii]